MFSVGQKAQLICRYTNAIRLLSSKVDLPSAMNYVNGERVVPCSSETFEVKEPGSGNLLGIVQCSGEQDVDMAVQSGYDALGVWSSLAWCDRAPILNKAAAIIRKRQNELAIMDTIDTGRNINEIQYDIACGADTLDYYAALATTNVDQYVKLPNDTFSYITKEPYGVVGAIGSWNFPFLGATWKVAPGLVSGNAIVYKPSPLAPMITPVLAEIFHEAGLPSGLFNVIQGGANTGTLLCKHPHISKLSFTGGIETGKKVLENCASGIKPVTLELGGKSPLIIFPDCDLDNAISAALNANLELGGESCTNGTRVFVHESIKDKFVEQLLGRIRQVKVGNPMDSDVQMGAMISEEHLIKILSYIESAKNEGAKVELGGERLHMVDPDIAGGYYISPCVLTNCRDEMKAVKEEIFGPVMAILTFESEEDVLKRANNTNYGLASGVFTRDLARAYRCASKLNAGTCWVNSYNIFHHQMPTGGFKMSGIGRENGYEALDAYTQTKVVYVNSGEVKTPY